MKNTLLVFAVWCLTCGLAYSSETEPISQNAVRIKLSGDLATSNFKENGIREGHKSLVGVGLTALKENLGYLEIGLWHMGEPLDEDRELPRRGYLIGAGILHEAWHAGFAQERIERTPNGKYGISWDELSVLTLRARYEHAFGEISFKAGILFPIHAEANDGYAWDGRITPSVEIRKTFKRTAISWFWNEEKLVNNEVHHPITLKRYGLRFSYWL